MLKKNEPYYCSRPQKALPENYTFQLFLVSN